MLGNMHRDKTMRFWKSGATHEAYIDLAPGTHRWMQAALGVNPPAPCFQNVKLLSHSRGIHRAPGTHRWM